MGEKDKNYIDCFVVCGQCGRQILVRGRVDSEPASKTGKDLIIHLEADKEMIKEGKILCADCLNFNRDLKDGKIEIFIVNER